MPAEFAAFRDWTIRYIDADPGPVRDALETEGVPLATTRREAMRAAIVRDPRAALAISVPAAVREQLPASVATLLESRVSGTGDVDVWPIERSVEGEPVDTSGEVRTVSLEGRSYEPHTFGRRRAQLSKQRASLWGIAIDETLALHASPVRILDPGERITQTVQPLCPVLGTTVDAPAIGTIANLDTPRIVELHGLFWALSDPALLDTLVQRVERAEALPGPRVPAFAPGGEIEAPFEEAPPTAWTTGTKTVLVLRVDFSDRPGDPIDRVTNTPITAAYAASLMDGRVRQYYEASSYNKTTLATTVGTPLFRMPKSSQEYALSGDSTAMHNDAKDAARTQYNPDNYDVVLLVFSYIGPSAIAGSKMTFGGRATVGGSRTLINGYFEFAVVAHELGHNYGLRHANLWSAFSNPIGTSGTNVEYGDDFDIMGSLSARPDERHDFNPWFKNRLSWVPDSAVTTATASGTYRIHRFDASDAPLTQPLAINVFRDGSRSYWISHRRSLTTNPALLNGAYLQWGFYSNRQSLLLDMVSPGNNAQDAPLPVGSELRDTSYGVTLRPVATGGSAPSEFLDVEVTVEPVPRNIVAHWGEEQSTPVPQDLTDVIAIAAGDEHGLALLRNGTLRIWGDNSFGELNIPFIGGTIASIAAGGDVSGVVRSDGTIVVWGDSQDGQTTPPPGLNNVKQLALGGNHALALKNDGTVVAWGGNARGQITLPTDLTGVQAISAGRDMTLLLMTDGTVRHLGVNAGTLPAGLNDIVAVSAGWGHALALKGNGTVVAWGSNASGQSSVPPGLDSVKQIGAGYQHSVALRNDGTIVAWGGDSLEQVTVPRGLPPVEAIAVAENHTMALIPGTNAPIITSQPYPSLTVDYPGSISMTVAVESPTAARYQWQRQPAGSAEWTDLVDNTRYTGANTSQLRINTPQPSESGDRFRCRISNDTPYSVTSSHSELTVRLEPLSFWRHPGSTSVSSTMTATLRAAATGTGPITYRWQRLARRSTEWLDLTNDGTHSSATTSDLSIVVSYSLTGSQYRCIASNGGLTPDAISSAATLNVLPRALAFNLQPVDVETNPGAKAIYTVAADGEGTVSFQWQRRAPGQTAWVDLTNGSGISGTTSDALTVDPVTSLFAGSDFRALATDIASQSVTSTQVRLHLVMPPAALAATGPGGTPIAGGHLTLSAPPPEGAAPSYQWRRNGTAVPGASDRVLTLTDLTGAQDGFYDTVITDPSGGSVVLDPVQVRVEPAAYLDRFVSDSEFRPRFERRGARVNGLMAAPGGDGFYAWGEFETIDGESRIGLARLTSDGRVDMAFRPPPVRDFRVYSMAAQPDGKVVVGSGLLQAGRLPHTDTGVSRLLADGSLDPAFSPLLISSGVVSSLVITADGSIVAAGSFVVGSDSTRRYLVKLKPDGSIDPGFGRPVTRGDWDARVTLESTGTLLFLGQIARPGNVFINGLARLDANGDWLESLTLPDATESILSYRGFPDGSLFVATNKYRLLRLRRDGSLDPDFTPFPVSHIPSIIEISGTSVAIRDSSRYYNIHIKIIDASGAIVSTFDGPTGPFLADETTALILHPDRSIIAGGKMSGNGMPRENLFRATSAGQLDPLFRPAFRLEGEVRAIDAADHGGWYVGGNFEIVNGIAANNLVCLRPDGSVDPTFTAPAFNGPINAVAAMPDGSVAAGGEFNSVGSSAVPVVALLRKDGALLGTFPEIFWGRGHALTTDASGRLLVGGLFAPTLRGTLLPGLLRLNRVGRIDPAFRPPGLETHREVFALLPGATGDFIMAGAFASVGGTTRSSVAGITADGVLAPQPGTVADFLGNRVNRAVTHAGDGCYWLGGDFRIGPSTSGRANLIRVLPSGAIDPATTTTGGPTSSVANEAGVRTLVPQRDGKVIVAGMFDHFSGSPSNPLVRVLRDGHVDPTFRVPSVDRAGATPHVRALRVLANGDILVAGNWMRIGDVVSGGLIRLKQAPPAPLVSTQPASQSVAAGGGVTLTAAANSSTPQRVQWLRNGVAIPGATSTTLHLPSAQAFHAGTYTAVFENDGGPTVSAPATITVNATPSPDARVLNLSTRALAQPGENALIPGFVLQGAGQKRMLIRVIGPELAKFGVAGALADPQMMLKRREGAATIDLASNDDWGLAADPAAIIAEAARVGAFPLTPGGKDAALLIELDAGVYTVVTSGADGGSGVSMVELYDASTTAAGARLVNIANRGFVGTGGDIMIPGFVISSEGPKTLLMRAVGPGLANFGVAGTLADPRLTIYQRQADGSPDSVILSNDNWGENGDAASVSATAAQVGAFPLTSGSKDAAFVVTLPPGVYTVHASGVNHLTGVALVEIYGVE